MSMERGVVKKGGRWCYLGVGHMAYGQCDPQQQQPPSQHAHYAHYVLWYLARFCLYFPRLLLLLQRLFLMFVCLFAYLVYLLLCQIICRCLFVLLMLLVFRMLIAFSCHFPSGFLLFCEGNQRILIVQIL